MDTVVVGRVSVCCKMISIAFSLEMRTLFERHAYENVRDHARGDGCDLILHDGGDHVVEMELQIWFLL